MAGQNKTITGTIEIDVNHTHLKFAIEKLCSTYSAIDANRNGQSNIEIDVANNDNQHTDKKTDSSTEKHCSINVPFLVTLTFLEKEIKPLTERILESLKVLFGVMVKTLSSLKNPAKDIVSDLSQLLSELMDNPSQEQQESIEALRKQIGSKKSNAPELDFNHFSKKLQELNTDELKNLKLDQVNLDNWKSFIEKILTIEASPTDTPVSDTKDFELTQIMGWLDITDCKSETPSFSFKLQGDVKYASDRVEYANNGRFDILGPDGSQLVTYPVQAGRLEEWFDHESNPVKVIIGDPQLDLIKAIERQYEDNKQKSTKTIKGRLWFTDGQAFGERRISIYAPPAFAKTVDGFGDCCDEDELIFSLDDDCCGELPSIMTIRSPMALASEVTDDSGYFEFTYDDSVDLTANYALIQINGVRAALAIKLEVKDCKKTFPQPFLLAVESSLIAPENESKKEIQWVLDEEKKCGGGNFGEPNRALDEFHFDLVIRTTDPLIERKQLQTCDEQPRGNLSPNNYFRVPLNRDNKVEWDCNPLIAQAVTISHGRILTIKQVWRADGYSQGDLLYSLPLAPLQKKNIAVIDWDRKDSFFQDEQRTNNDYLKNVVSRERDISEIVNTALTQKSQGQSDSGGGSSSSGGGGFLGFSLFGASSSGSSNAWSSSSEASSRNLVANFLNQLRDRTSQAASSFRTQRITSVQQIHQSEHTQAVTETVANRNACHAVTIQYFEVLRHFKVEHELAAVRECLYIPLPIERFDAKKIKRWRNSIQAYLPNEQLAGISAMDRLEVGFYPSGRFADENINDLYGELEVTLAFPPPVVEISNEQVSKDDINNNYNILNQFLSELEIIKALPSNKKEEYFISTVAPLITRKFVEDLNFIALDDGISCNLSLKAILVNSYHSGKKHNIVVNITGPLSLIRTKIKKLRIESGNKLPTVATFVINRVQFYYSTNHFSHSLIDQYHDHLSYGIPAELATPLHSSELKNPKNHDEIARDKLIEHLNEHVEFYHKAIWWTMDPDRRFTLLDNYIAPHSGGRSVASVVENRLVGIVGNTLVMPVAPGITLDYFNDIDKKDNKEKYTVGEDALLEAYRPLIQNPGLTISIPTKGVFAESVMGKCNGCEKIDDSRNWRYWEHPLPDESTPIEPLSTASRFQQPPNPKPTDLPQSTINQVVNNLPSAPDPTGLAKALEILGNANAFRDPTGLAGTQQNARESLAASFATTSKFGELAQQAMMQTMETVTNLAATYSTGLPIMNSAPKIKDAIGKDAAAGRITPEQAQDAFSRVNNALADSLSIGKVASLLDHEGVSAAILAAADRGTPLKVSKGDTHIETGDPPENFKLADEEGKSSSAKYLLGWFSSKSVKTKKNKDKDTNELVNKIALDDNSKILAAIVYGEASTKNSFEEMCAIANVLVRQQKARGYKSIKDFIETDKNFAYAAHDGNKRYEKFMAATEEEITFKGSIMIGALVAANQALADNVVDYANGAYFWDGADIKSNYAVHPKVLAGIHFTNPNHNIYNLKETEVQGENWWKNTKGKKLKLRGTWKYKYESTAAHGGTIFWKYSQDFLNATGNKPYK